MPKVIDVKRAQVRKDKDGNVKPNHRCDRCSVEIKPGDPYKHMSIKTGPFSSQKLVRCARCPRWEVWEYSQSVSARLAQIVHDARAAAESAETKDDVEAALQQAAESIKEIAEEKREGASNIEDGFGHSTYQSDELNELADSLESWADSVESADIPEDPDPEDAECAECNGKGTVLPESADELPAGTEVELETCEECAGSGHPDEPTQDQIDEWESDVEDALSILDESPV